MASTGREPGTVAHAPFVLGVAPGAIVAGFDVHRRQITIDALDTVTGEVWRGQIESSETAVTAWARAVPGPGDPRRGRGLHGLVVCLSRAVGVRRGHAS